MSPEGLAKSVLGSAYFFWTFFQKAGSWARRVSLLACLFCLCLLCLFCIICCSCCVCLCVYVLLLAICMPAWLPSCLPAWLFGCLAALRPGSVGAFPPDGLPAGMHAYLPVRFTDACLPCLACLPDGLAGSIPRQLASRLAQRERADGQLADRSATCLGCTELQLSLAADKYGVKTNGAAAKVI